MGRLTTNIIKTTFRVHAWLKGRRPESRPFPEPVKSILLVSTTGLGDTAVSTPAIHAAGRAWPDARLNVLAHARWAGMLEADPAIDKVIAYPGKFKNIWNLTRSLRSLAPDLALILHHNDPDIIPLVYMSGARFIVCRDSTPFNFLLDRPVSITDPLRHIVERRMDIVRAATDRCGQAGPLRIVLPEDKKAWASEYWLTRGVKKEDRLIVLNPGGSRQPKRWPSDHWKKLIDRFRGRRNLRIALFGSSSEREPLEELASSVTGPEVLVEAGRPLIEAASLIESAMVMIGPDSGLAHVAQGLGVPVIILFGPDNIHLSGPRFSSAKAAALQLEPDVCPDIGKCRKKDCRPNRCMEGVTPDMVIEALKNDLELHFD